MQRPSGRAYVLAVCLVGLAAAGCTLIGGSDSPTAPTPVSPPAAGSAVRYAAIGASDANGVGSTVPCLPFAPCENGTGYVPVLAQRLRASRDVTVTNLGIPASVLSPAIEVIARQQGRDVTGNFLDRQMPFVPRDATLVTIFGGGNDANAIGDAVAQGAASGGAAAYIDTQARTFGADYDRLVRGIRSRAPGAYVVVINLPNLAALPYGTRYPLEHRRVLQAIAVAFSRQANRQAGSGVAVLDLMCDPAIYDPSRLSQDGFHPNDSGYAHMAARLASLVDGGPAPVAASCAAMTVVPPL